MPSRRDSDPRFWGGRNLPVEKEIVTAREVDAIVKKIGCPGDRKVRAKMPLKDGTHVKKTVTVKDFLLNRLNRIAVVYRLEVSESKQPTSLKTRKTISTARGHVDKLLKSLGLPLKRPANVSPELWPPHLLDTLYPFARNLAKGVRSTSIQSSPVPGRTLLGDTLDSLYWLSVILREADISLREAGNARYVLNPESNLLVRLQSVYEEAFGRKASDVVNPKTNKASGPWYSFAAWACIQIGASLNADRVRGRWRNLRRNQP